MIIGLTALITFLVSILGSGGFMTDPKFEKHVKQFVEDPAKEKAIMAELHDFHSVYKKHNHELNALTKAFVMLSEQKESPKSLFNKTLDEIKGLKKQIQDDGIKYRLSIVSNMTESEWNSILDAMDEDRDKFTETSNKAFSDIVKDMSLTEMAIDKYVLDETKNSACKEAFEKYKTDVLDVISSSIKINLHENEILRKYGANEEELKSAFSETNYKRSRIYNSYYSFHEIMAKNTSLEEWRHIIKTIRKAY